MKYKVDAKDRLSFTDIKRVIGEHLRTALNVKNFSITFAKQEGDKWRVNVQYEEVVGLLTWQQTALFTLDAKDGGVLEFEKGRTYQF